VTPAGTAVVSVKGLTRVWRGGGGLGPTDFRLDREIVLCVRGPSGSGKSTLLALLSEWTTPEGGEIVWHPPLDGPTRATWAGVAIVPQSLALLPELSVLENVAVAAGGGGDAVDRADAALEALDVEEFATRTVETLSMGQRQRVAVARALVAEPVLVLADEPTSHQDARHAALVVAELRARAERGSGVIVATHDPVVVEAADLVLDLDRIPDRRRGRRKSRTG
jgi:putative ABC transport system ATP-binding protein